MNINYPYITEYIRNTIAPNNGFLQGLENYAAEHNVPIIQPETARLLQVMCAIKKPKKILEIGTAIGYSSILMCQSLDNNCSIISIEKDVKVAEIAQKNIKDAGLDNSIDVYCGDAVSVLDSINESFDLIFIDASKSHYMEFLNKSLNKLNPNGIIISDNVLFKGMIANDKLVDKRNRTIVRKMREYLDYICNDKIFDTSIIPIGDGVAISIKIDN